MTATYTAGATDRDTVRLLVGDTDTGQPLWQDADLDAFLTLEGDVKLAAAQALDTEASSEARVQKRIRLLDLSTDGPAVAKALREHAAELRRQVDQGESDLDGLFDWAGVVYDDFSYREQLVDDILRNQVAL